jgi:hypothetical protein
MSRCARWNHPLPNGDDQVSADSTLTPFLNAIDWPDISLGAVEQEARGQGEASVLGAVKRGTLRLLMHVVRP